MKNIAFHMMAAALVIAPILTACSNDDDWEDAPMTEPGRTAHTATMILQGGLTPFDATRAATSTTWADGSAIYLQFSVGSSLVDGKATYNATVGEWTVEYYGTLTKGQSCNCKAYYFENAGESTAEGIALTEHTAVYADASGSYLWGDQLIVTAALVPTMGRFRLTGTANQAYRFNGASHYSYYDFTSDSFTTSTAHISGALDSNGGSDYFYVFFPDGSDRTLAFDDTDDANVYYTKKLGSDIFSAGRSGYMNCPSSTNRSGWTRVNREERITVTISNVTFDMILVEGGTFQMGSTKESDEKPIHSVTLSPYYIGETEVTEKLWKTVMGSNPSYNAKGDNYPVEYVSWNDCQTFITKLNAATGLTFRLPTEAEWEFAARGGNKSKGYTYSGSNTLDNVAWYAVNSSAKNAVKTKAANELGLYDMTGNVWEWCQDWYNSTYYSNSPDTNPTGPATGSNRVFRGGSWIYSATYCRVAYRYCSTPSFTSSNLGLRLAL